MQINVIEYFEKGAALKCADKVAVVEQNRQFTFREIERFAKNCAALILQRTSATRQPIPVFLPKSAGNIVADLGILYSGNDQLKQCSSRTATFVIEVEIPATGNLRNFNHP